MEKISQFELAMRHKYPMAQDHFYISHGNNYMEWFNRLGNPDYYWIGNKQGSVVGTACGVLRTIGNVKTWYICDLKVDSAHRGNGFSMRCLAKGLIPSYFKSNKCFAICMQPNLTIGKIINKLTYPKIKPSEKINIYLLDSSDVINWFDEIERYYSGNFTLMSNLGVKDIILESTGKALQVLHLKKSDENNKVTISNIQSNYKYFIALIESDGLNAKFADKLFGSAIIYSYNMENFDWKQISSGEI